MGTKHSPFPKVAQAREALKERAIEVLETYLAVIAEARAAGEFDVATRSLQWLMEHMPSADDGVKIIDQSIDKPKIEAPSGPSINIGFALGGMGEQKSLPPVTIEAEVIKQDE